MSKCSICNRSVFDYNIMLHRTKPIGTPDSGTCMLCIKRNEAELASNIQEELDNNPVIKDLKEICFTGKENSKK